MASKGSFPEWLAPGSLPGGRTTEIKQSSDGLARLAHTEAPDKSWCLTAYEIQIGSGGKFTPTLAVETSVVPGTEGHRDTYVLVTDSFQYFPPHEELVASQVALLPDGRSIPINTFIFGPWGPVAEHVMQAMGVMQEAPKAYQVDFDATAQALNDQFSAGDFSRPPQIVLKSP